MKTRERNGSTPVTPAFKIINALTIFKAIFPIVGTKTKYVK